MDKVCGKEPYGRNAKQNNNETGNKNPLEIVFFIVSDFTQNYAIYLKIDTFALMKRIIQILIILLIIPTGISADKKDKQQRLILALSEVYKGDTIPSFQLMDVNIYGRKNFSSRKKQKKYDKMVRDVLKTYPLSKEIKGVLVETYLYLQTLPDDESRQKHMEEVEKGVWNQYLPVMKKLTLSQGKMLIKLIDRECNQTSYELINAFIGRFKAGFYQTFAAIFGATLKKEYDPTGADAEIEEIIFLMENDMLQIVK